MVLAIAVLAAPMQIMVAHPVTNAVLTNGMLFSLLIFSFEIGGASLQSGTLGRQSLICRRQPVSTVVDTPRGGRPEARFAQVKPPFSGQGGRTPRRRGPRRCRRQRATGSTIAMKATASQAATL